MCGWLQTVISEDVPSCAVIVGDPARIVKYFDADDTIEEKKTIDFIPKHRNECL